MKRSEALRSLSRDHHQALVVARKLERADDALEAAAVFLGYWNDHGQGHFRIEEEVLLPYWARLGVVNGPAAAQLAREHLEIRAGALAIANEPRLDSIRELGQRIAAHVRFEERELFPLIEAELGTAALEQLARAVADAEARL